jgi:hypothetical protein
MHVIPKRRHSAALIPKQVPPRATLAGRGLAAQFTHPRGRWLRICQQHAGALVPRHLWTDTNVGITLARAAA